MVPDLGRSNFAPGDVVSAGSETTVPSLRRKILKHKQQLGEAYIALLLFMVVYCARPEDWIPGLSSVPLAKIAGVLALVAFLLSLDQMRRACAGCSTFRPHPWRLSVQWRFGRGECSAVGWKEF